MSKKYPGGLIRGTPITPTASAASGIWTVCQAQNYTRQGIWPRSPGAPTIGTATAGATGSGQATVAFTAPSETGSAAITSYTATSTPGNITGTSASSPITVTGLTNGTAYTFKVRATNGAGSGPESAASNSITVAVPTCATYTTPGTFTWVAPAGVTSIAVVAVGGGGSGAFGGGCSSGGGGGGGGLAYRNSVSVTPGSSYTVVVANGGTAWCVPAQSSSFNASTIATGGNQSFSNRWSSGSGGAPSGSFTGGGNGGSGGTGTLGTNEFRGAGAGGAGGYSGNGGSGAAYSQNGQSGSGGGGGGGASPYPSGTISSSSPGGYGGGVGIYGQGSNGAGATWSTGGPSQGANGGDGSGGIYGGGGGGAGGTSFRTGNSGAVRIVWCLGGTRGTPSFPSTNVGP